MYYGVVATVNSYVTAVADDVARLCLREADAVSDASHGAGGMGQAHTKVGIYAHDESGTVRSVGQAVSSRYIRIADITESCGCDGRTTAPS